MASDPDEVPRFDPVAFGLEISRRRIDLKITQDKLAEATGLSRVQVQNIERGLSDRDSGRPANPRLSTLLALARALNGRIVVDVRHASGVVVEFDDESRRGR